MPSFEDMNRSTATLGLLGHCLLVVGLVMMLRFLVGPQGGMIDAIPAEVMALRDAAGRDIFIAYVLLIASGSGLVVASFAMLLARRLT